MRSLLIVLLDVEEDLIDKVTLGFPYAAFRGVSSEDIEPDFDLIEPRGVGGSKVKSESFST